jgi:hypothetical protein
VENARTTRRVVLRRCCLTRFDRLNGSFNALMLYASYSVILLTPFSVTISSSQYLSHVSSSYHIAIRRVAVYLIGHSPSFVFGHRYSSLLHSIPIHISNARF